MKRFPKALFEIAAIALVAGLAAGCASTGGTGSDEDHDGPTFTLQVDNDGFQDARVQVFWDQTSQNLGRIRGSSTQSFELPYHGNRVRLRVEFVEGSGRYDTDYMTVNPDQVLTYRIDP